MYNKMRNKTSLALLFILIAIPFLFLGGCKYQSASQGSAVDSKTNESKEAITKTQRDDLGCFYSCKYFPEGFPMQMCEDWKAGKQVYWPDDCSIMQYEPCIRLCETEKKENKGTASGSARQNIPAQSAQKLAAHEMPNLLDMEFKSGVDESDEEKMREGFKIMDFYLDEWFSHSITRKSSIIVEAANDDSKFLEENGKLVFLYRTLSSDWQLPKQIGAQYNMDMRSRAAAHEYVHLYQINDGCAHLGREGEKVKWFLEGEAEWLSYKAFDESGNFPYYSGWKQLLLSQAVQSEAELKPLQAYEEGTNLESIYSYFTLAIEFLVKNKDIRALDDFCTNLGKGQELSIAFQNAFGITLDKFYEDFEAYRKTW